MYLTIINGYELGQFLRILLWICVPIAMFVLLVTTWLQHRRRQVFSEGLFLSMEGVSAVEEEAMTYHGGGVARDGLEESGSGQNRGESGVAEKAVAEVGGAEPGRDETSSADARGAEWGRSEMGGDDQSRDDRVEEREPRLADTFGEGDYKENLYKGILWMKDKYEQYREMADQRYERLKDQLTKVEMRYEELLSTLGSPQPVVGAKPAEPATQLETEAVEPISLVDPVGMESIFPAESGPLGEGMFPAGQRVETQESRLWNPEPRVEMADMPVAEREERTHTQELEEQLARTRQRLEEELGRVRHQLEDEIARSRRQQDEQAAVAETNRHLEQQMVYSNRQLEEKQRIIADLEGQLRSDKQKIEELVTKLRNNSQLLMKIYQELDKSLHFNDVPKEG
jgi:hypothetical protein